MHVMAVQELKAANANFEFVEDELVDYYTYQIKANQAKLNYLIKKSKANDIKMDRVGILEFKNLHYDVI